MKVSINQFFIALSIIGATLFYFSFADFYFKHKQNLSDVIYKSIVYDLSDLSYLIARNAGPHTPISSLGSLITRKAASNDFICDVLIFDNEKLVYSTEDNCNQPPENTIGVMASRNNHEPYEILTQYDALKTKLRVFDNVTAPREYTIYFAFEKKKLKRF